MTHRQTNAPPVRSGALEVVFDGQSVPQDTPETSIRQAALVARRFGLVPATAGAVAALAYGEACA